MLPADVPFELKQMQHPARSPRFSHVIGIASSLIVHAALLLHVTASPPAWIAPQRIRVPDDAAIQVFLLERDPAPMPVPIAARPSPTRPVPRMDRPSTSQAAPGPATAPPSRPAAPIPEDAPASAAQLFGGIQGVARDLTASDQPYTGNGPDPALARLPGRSEAFVDLPLPVKRRPTPEQVGMFIAKLVVGTMVAHPDDWESATKMRNPLRDMTDAHIENLIDPVCNDPDDPLKDERCWK